MESTGFHNAATLSSQNQMLNPYQKYALIFKSLSDETRLEILVMISRGEMCACEILNSFQIAQPTLSYHMKMLSDCGLVSCRRDGKRVLYTIEPQWENFLFCLQKNMFDNLTMPFPAEKE